MSDGSTEPRVVTADEARRDIDGLVVRVNADRVPVRIVASTGEAILLAAAEWNAILETEYLLRTPANARRLMEGIEQAASSR